jgi:YHS domain-containing protein
MIKKRLKDGIHYTMFSSGNYYDFTENLELQVGEQIRFMVACGDSRLSQQGTLEKKEKKGKFYYSINKENLNEFLNKCVGYTAFVEMKNITEE